MTKAEIKRIDVVLDEFFKGLKIECVKENEEFEIFKEMMFSGLNGLEEIPNCEICDTYYKKDGQKVYVDFDYASIYDRWDELVSDDFKSGIVTYAEVDELTHDAMAAMKDDNWIIDCQWPTYDSHKNDKQYSIGGYKVVNVYIDTDFGGIGVGVVDKEGHEFDLFAQLDADDRGNLFLNMSNPDNKFIYTETNKEVDIFANEEFSKYVSYEEAIDIVKYAINVLAVKKDCVTPVYTSYEAE